MGGIVLPRKEEYSAEETAVRGGGRHDGGADNYTAQNRNVFALIFIALYCNV